MNAAADERLDSVDFVLSLIELLAGSPQPRALGEIARMLDTSKARTHRHLRALVAAGYARQDIATDRYEISAKLVGLGEAVRERLSFGAAARPAMARLRDATGQAVTASALVGGLVTIVELLQGRTLVQFAIRPGTVMDGERSAHGLVAQAFAATNAAPGDRIEAIRRQGWATAPEQVVRGVNALAAPVFGHDGAWAGTVAIVGSIDCIAEPPAAALVAEVVATAREISEQLGWTAKS